MELVAPLFSILVIWLITERHDSLLEVGQLNYIDLILSTTLDG